MSIEKTRSHAVQSGKDVAARAGSDCYCAITARLGQPTQRPLPGPRAGAHLHGMG